jgi:dolichol-phosphate mannosyltransferase
MPVTGMRQVYDFAVIVPMADEESSFAGFISCLKTVLDKIGGGVVYLITDTASRDNTPELCRSLAETDRRFVSVHAPENRNVVDAYLCGYRHALSYGHSLIIEMDAGMSHDPCIIPRFLELLDNGYECVFGSRFVKGGRIINPDLKRFFISRTGTLMANTLLGTCMADMTSGFQGFKRHVVEDLLKLDFRSKAHFFQTEVRYFLRNRKYIEIPITYTSPSSRISAWSLCNSVGVLWYYFMKRSIYK